MKRFILFFLLCSGLWNQGMTQVVSAEYFFDTDPGFGNGTTLSVAAGTTVNVSAAIGLNMLSKGVHVFYLRAKNATGSWSLYKSQLIAVLPDSGGIDAVEYFFDTDPGYGHGTPLAFAPGSTVQLSVPVDVQTLPLGLHYIGLRARNSGDAWSLVSRRLFTVLPSGGLAFTYAEAFIDGPDPGFGNATPVDISASGIVQNDSLFLSGLANGSHTLYFRAYNANGAWSLYQPVRFTVCNTYGAVSDFDYNVYGSTVLFNNKSVYDSTHRWMYGDGMSDSLINAEHIYTAPGNFNVCLITSNACATDTSCKTVTIRGVQSCSPGAHYKNGILLMTIKGFGFYQGLQASLSGPVTSSILADSTTFIDSETLLARFILQNADTGLYDVGVTDGLVFQDSLKQAFRITEEGTYNPWLRIQGRRYNLLNTWSQYSILVGNDGTETRFMVPITISLPRNIEGVMVSPIDQTNVPANVRDSMPDFILFIDSLAGDTTKECFLMLSALEPGIVYHIDFALRSSLLQEYEMKVSMGHPFADSMYLADLGLRSCYYPPCLQCAMTLGKFIPQFNCATSGADFICDLAGTAVSGISSNAEAGKAVFNIGKDLVSAVSGCFYLGGWYNDYKELAGTLKAIKNGGAKFKDIASAGGFAVGGAIDANENAGACGSCYGVTPDGTFYIKNLSAYDPNEKDNPKDLSGGDYVNLRGPLNYTIHFENVDTASAPASTVIVNDTLDPGKFDLSTFQFTGFSIGDTMLSVTSSPNHSFSTDFDLRPAKNSILRLHGELDTLTGAMSCAFVTLDTLQFGPIDDFSQGFLPPNVNAPEGEASISYMVRTKTSLAHLDTVLNRATITFDNNQPIQTSQVNNILDTVSPESHVDFNVYLYNDTLFRIGWTGNDDGSGIHDYRLYIVINDTVPLVLYHVEDADTLLISGTFGYKYAFYTVARDNVLNEEEPPNGPDLIIRLTGVEEVSEGVSYLYNFPNPFSTETNVMFHLLKAGNAHVELVDMTGRLVFVTNQSYFHEGLNRIRLSCADLYEGIYFYRLVTEKNGNLTRKMILQK